MALVLFIYWLPSYFSVSYEYKNWAYVFIFPWLISGYAGSLIGYLLKKKLMDID